MAATQQKYYGMTPPISTAEPSQKEIQATDRLFSTLKELGLFENEQESRKRELVLGKLSAIFKEFVKVVSLSQGVPESMAAEAGGKIFTFGSYRLGVHGRGSDIDTLCVSPKHVKREDFFDKLYEMLKTRPEVTEMAAVSDAYVPVLKFQFSDIPIDLLFAQLDRSTVPDDLDLSDDNLLKGLDERCIRSLNGSRVTDEILRLVPNIDAFRIALRCVKLWAKRRAIYSNVMGFFGGVAWAILVARVCQLYPNAAAGSIVSKFFRIMHKWAWPQPVLLKQIEEGPLAVRVWNPKIYPQDKAHRMPIITPAYPSMCATHNVTISTQQVTTQEFERAADIADKIMVGSARWVELFTKSDFFSRYKFYLQIIASSKEAESHLRWSGMIESRLRQLVMKLELVDHLELAHPYIEGFDRTAWCVDEEERNQAAHGQFPPNREESEIDKSTATKIHTTTFYIGLCVKARDPNSNSPRKLDISWPTRDFVGMVRAWDKFEPSSMGIVVQYMKSCALPKEVFAEGELPRAMKRRTKSRTRLNSQPEESHPAKKRRASCTDSVPVGEKVTHSECDSVDAELYHPSEPETADTSKEKDNGVEVK
ncbi:polymerase [Phlyctochytrium arcticum]|nr:polymerase [Phlyctochytrium arcticum]